MSLLAAIVTIKKGAQLWLLVKPIQRWKNRKGRKAPNEQENPAVKERKMLKGKLTYISWAAVGAPILGRLLGIELAEADLVALISAGFVLVGIFGRWRATR